jgi:hypothetical protein
LAKTRSYDRGKGGFLAGESLSWGEELCIDGSNEEIIACGCMGDEPWYQGGREGVRELGEDTANTLLDAADCPFGVGVVDLWGVQAEHDASVCQPC